MDESKNSFPPNKLVPWSAPDRRSAVADTLPADLAGSRERTVLRRRPSRDDLSGGASTVVYYGNDEAVNQGFLIALRAMGVVVFEDPAGPAMAFVARIKP